MKIQETWGKKALEFPTIKVLFFLGEETTDLVGDCFIHLPGVQNDYMSASYKQFLGLQYIEAYFPCRFVFVCGTDTYVNVPLLLQYTWNFNHEKPLYIGGHGLLRELKNRLIYFHDGGAGFLLSYACQKGLKSIYPIAVDIWTTLCEEETTTHYLKSACDIALGYFVEEVFAANAIFYTPKHVFSNCNYNGQSFDPELYELTCCAIQPHNWLYLLSCHQMSLQHFDEFTQILEDNGWFVEEDKLGQEVVYY